MLFQINVAVETRNTSKKHVQEFWFLEQIPEHFCVLLIFILLICVTQNKSQSFCVIGVSKMPKLLCLVERQNLDLEFKRHDQTYQQKRFAK